MNTSQSLQADINSNLRGPARWRITAPLLMVASLVGACQFAPVLDVTPTVSPAVPPASIAGRAWLDECESAGICPTVTPGTTQNTADGPGTNVRGISGLEVSLGQGPCPSTGFASQQTDAGGVFNFSDLQPGFYCVTARANESMDGAWLTPASLPSERSASYTLALGPGEQRRDVQFIWKPGDRETPLAPTATPSVTPSCTNLFSLVEDVTIEDGERVDPEAQFRKVWHIRNEGTCAWSAAYSWVFVSGYQLGAPESIQVPSQVGPNVMLDVSLDMQAPAVSGTYRGYWMMRSPGGELFGTGAGGNQPVWVEIKVGPEPTPVITDWRGEYFNNHTLSGEPSLIRNDKNVDFDWGRKAPADGLPSDNFSARWTRTLHFDAAIYRFTVSSDDGVRLWVDDRLVIDEWKESDLNRESVDLAMVSGKHTIIVEYFERSGDANISLRWKKVNIDDSNGWIARFWFNRSRDSKWALVQTPSNIDYDWGSKSPALGIPSDNFSASWSRTLSFEPARYRFTLRADDGVHLYLDDELVIDEWHDAVGETYAVERDVSGTHQLQVLFYEHKGNARVEFDWVKVGPANQPPVALSDGYETTVDTALNVLDPGLLENDTDPDGDPLTAFKVSGPSHGELVLHENGAFSYRPDPGYAGEDSFIYRASDGKLESADTVVKITIQREDQLPAAVDDAVETQEDLAVTIDVLANDRGLGDAPIQIVSVGAAAHGSTAIDGTAITYTPSANFFGEDSFTYTIADQDGDQSSAIVTVQVIAVNDPPQAEADSYEVNEDGTLTLPDPGVLENDHDPEVSAITAVLVKGVKHGTLKLNPDGSLTYVPDENYSGDDQFTYRASDGSETSAEVTVSLTINPVEDLPAAVEDSFEVAFEQALIVEAPGVLANDADPDGDEITAVLDQGPSHGELVLNADGSFQYTPEPGFTGSDSFTYWVEDGKGRSESVTVSLTVLPPA